MSERRTGVTEEVVSGIESRCDLRGGAETPTAHTVAQFMLSLAMAVPVK